MRIDANYFHSVNCFILPGVTPLFEDVLCLDRVLNAVETYSTFQLRLARAFIFLDTELPDGNKSSLSDGHVVNV